MAELNFAAIDIGTNAVRLMIKGIDAGKDAEEKLFKRLLLRIPLRLGNDVFTFGKITEDKKEQLLHSILAFKELMLVGLPATGYVRHPPCGRPRTASP